MRLVMPSRGKRRCARNADDASTSLDVKEEKMDKKDALGGDNEDGVELHDHMAVSCSNSEEEIKIGAMRARKLVKYCSLESFTKHRKREMISCPIFAASINLSSLDKSTIICNLYRPPFLLGQVKHHMQLVSIAFPPWTSRPSYATPHVSFFH